MNQGFQEESPQGEEINVICTARYLPGAEKELEAGIQEPEAAPKKAEVGSQAAGSKGHKAKAKTQEAQGGSQKSQKGVVPSSAQESTPNRKPGR